MKYKIIIILSMIAVILVSNYSYQSIDAKSEFVSHLNKVEKICPNEYIVNRMPESYSSFSLGEFLEKNISKYITDVRDDATRRVWIEHLNEKGLDTFLEGGYFIVDGKRIELFDTDLEWINKNCELTPNYVY